MIQSRLKAPARQPRASTLSRDVPTELVRSSVGVGRQSLYYFGIAIVVFQLCYMIAPSIIAQNKYRFVFIIPQLIWLCLALTSRKARFAPSAMFFALCGLQIWGAVTGIFAEVEFTRVQPMGKQNTFLIEAAITLAFSAYLSTMFPQMIRVVYRTFVLVAAVSTAVGYCQFLKMGWAITLSRFYTYKPIDNWDYVEGVRAVGLTWHPRFFAFLCLMALVMVASHLITRKLKIWEVGALMFFSGGVVISQTRTVYLIFAVTWLLIGGLLLYRYRLAGVGILVAAAILVTAIFLGFGDRFGYARQLLGGTNDKSFQFRRDNSWAKVDEILRRAPITGVGQDRVAFIGTDQGRDRWSPEGLTESGYILFITMYGLVGFGVQIAMLAYGFVMALGAMHPANQPLRRQLGVLWLALTMFYAIALMTFNCVDELHLLSITMLLIGLGGMRALKDPYAIYRRRLNLATEPKA